MHVLDIPIVLPPLVVGLSLLILFQFRRSPGLRPAIVYQVPAVILAQFSVACAFSVRTMKGTFDQIDPAANKSRCVPWDAAAFKPFPWLSFPRPTGALSPRLTLAWARSLGEFGPLLIFAGSTRMKTEVLSTSVFLEMNVGQPGSRGGRNSLIMVAGAILVLILTRKLEAARSTNKGR
ncbi:MAG: hypothetical protein R3C12_04800 [Planctomycetaceae bacterium]